MPIVNVTLPTDNTSADVADYNDPLTAILAVLNGQLDDDNIASLNGSKITAGTLPSTAMAAATRDGWNTGVLPVPNSVAYNGNRSYDLVFNAADLTTYLTEGMRIRTTRTSAAPTQCTSLNGTTQYFVKTSPNKCTFVDDFVVSAWIKVTSYGTSRIMTRYNGTSGWTFSLNSSGQVELAGFNGGSGNNSSVTSSQSVPLNQWVHVTAQLDMSSFTATTTTSYVMFDTLDVPCSVSRNGTNPTALVQAGNLEIGSTNGGTQPFPGKIAQAAFFTAKVTQSTMRTYVGQGLSGSETSLGSAYSFNGVITDLNTTSPNDLSVGGGSAVATNADSPFGNSGISSTKDYAVIMNKSFATNTTITVQVPSGCTIPTTGGVSAIDYSTQDIPFGFPKQKNKWRISSIINSAFATTSNAAFGTFQNGGWSLNVPIGSWDIGWIAGLYNTSATAVFFNVSAVSLIGLTQSQAQLVSRLQAVAVSPSAATYTNTVNLRDSQNLVAQTSYKMYTLGSTTAAGVSAVDATAEIFAECPYI